MTWTFEHLRAAMESSPPLLLAVADATVKATALLLAAALATVLVRRASAASRHFVWSLAAAGTLALPMLAALLPSWRVAVLPPKEAPETLPEVPVVVEVLETKALLESPALLSRAELLQLDRRPLPPPQAPLVVLRQSHF